MVQTGRHPPRIKRCLRRSYGVLKRKKVSDNVDNRVNLVVDYDRSHWCNNVVEWVGYKVSKE